MYNHLDCVTAPSATAVELIKAQKIKEPLLAISCGINFKQYHRIENVERGAIRKKYGISEDSIVFQFVGRGDAEKRLEVITMPSMRLTAQISYWLSLVKARR